MKVPLILSMKTTIAESNYAPPITITKRLAHLFAALFLVVVCFYWTSARAKASELTFTDTVPFTKTPWVRVLSVPQFDPDLGALQRVTISVKVQLRGEGYYENRSDVQSVISFQHTGEMSLNFDSGDEIDTLIATAESSLVAPPYDGVGGFNISGPLPQNDEDRLNALFNGESGGLSVANSSASGNYTFTTVAELARFLGDGEIGIDVFADAESRANDTTGNVDYELRSYADAEVMVTYQYLTTAIQLEKTVYRGQDNGASCPGTDKIVDEQDNPITYCFIVTNTGETFLNNITISDTTLGITEQQMTLISGTQPLAPNAQMVFYLETKLDKKLVNLALVEGTPTSSTGVQVLGLPNPTDDDIAEVDFSPRALDESEEPLPAPKLFLPFVTR